MKKIWQKLPIEMVYFILEYNGSVKMRNGKYMNQICMDNIKYVIKPLIQKIYYIFYRYNRVSIISILIANTKKSFYYFATDYGIRITLHIANNEKYTKLYSNIEEPFDY